MNTNILTELVDLGLTPPKSLNEAVGVLEDLAAEAAGIGGRDPGQVTLTRFAKAAGSLSREEARSKFRGAALEAATALATRDLWAKVEPVLDARCHLALAEHGDDLVAEARPRFEKAAAHVAELVEKLGADPTAETAIESGHVEEYQAFAGAVAELEAAAGVVAVLSRVRSTTDMNHRTFAVAGYYSAGMIPAAYLADDPDLSGYQTALSAYRARGLVGLIGAGYTITLRPAIEAQALVAAVEAAKQKQVGEAERKAERLTHPGDPLSRRIVELELEAGARRARARA